MATLELIAQNVNGDPFIDGGIINITTGAETTLTFTDFDFQLHDPIAGETISLDGGITQLTYTFLGYGDVRGDLLQHAAFIRVDMGDGTFQTYAIDMNADGDQLPNLAAGNTKLTTADLSPGPSERFPGPACFTPGTLMDTPRGPVAVEELKVGDLVETLDDGPQPVRMILRNTFFAVGNLVPIRFAPGAIGNRDELLVSPQHRMLITGWRAELCCGRAEVLVAAKHLVDGKMVTEKPGGTVEYIHLVFDRHQIVFGGGVPSESYFPGGSEMPLSPETQEELETLFPELKRGVRTPVPLVRPMVRQHEAKLLRCA